MRPARPSPGAGPGRRTRTGGTVPVLLALLAAIPVSASAQRPDPGALRRVSDSVAAAYLERGPVAGFALGVSREGEVLVLEGYGQADLARGRAVTRETVFRLASVTKQYTAAGILRLAEEGRVDLDDRVTEYLPDFPENGITLRHLLGHTSGLVDYTDDPLRWLSRIALDLTHDEVLATFVDEPLLFQPGSAASYSNSGYYVLGMVLEEVTGLPYGEAMIQLLFRPLGLDDTGFCAEGPPGPPRAVGYGVGLDGLREAVPISERQLFASGGLCSDVEDVLAWLDALHGGRVLAPETYAAMTTPPPLPDCPRPRYGYGVVLMELHGRLVLEHSGSIHGFRVETFHVPAEELSVVVLANTDGAPVRELAAAVARRALDLEAAEDGLRPLPGCGSPPGTP